MASSSAQNPQPRPTTFPRGSDLRDGVTFPCYPKCPCEIDGSLYLPIDFTYFKVNPEPHRSPALLSPARHWCFIGEVIDAHYVLRLTLIVRDKDGNEVSVWFHDEDRGSRFVKGAKKPKAVGNSFGMSFFSSEDLPNQEDVKKNCTVMGQTFVLLYPQRHKFMDGSEGFKIENGDRYKMIPYSLDKLLSANDSVRSCPPAQICCAEGCEKTESLSLCSGCRISKYCSKEHQFAHWKSHKEPCKIFGVLKWFWEKDWENFSASFTFDSIRVY